MVNFSEKGPRRQAFSSARDVERDDRLARHSARLARITKELRTRTSHKPLSIRKAAVGHHVPKRKDARRYDDKIDLTDLTEILDIDTETMTCVAEPGVTFFDLVKATLPYGLIPIVVPELPSITVGGAVSGCSLESMSFRYGGFHDTCSEYEVVTAKGDVLHCTPDNANKLVFQMIHGSFGTLGIITKLKFKLTPAKTFVALTHQSFSNLRDYKAAIEAHFRAQDVDFMDGFIHSPTHFVLSLGRFVDRAPYTNRYDWLKVYYKSTAERTEDYIDTLHYVFRYDNGVTNVHPKSFLGRLFLGRFLHSAQLLRIAEKVPRVMSTKPDVTVDLFIPFSRVEKFLEWYEKSFAFVPLWVVPYRRVHDYEWIAPKFYENIDDELFLDLAIYGMKQEEGRNYYKEIEEELERVNGIKTLISHNFYEENEFWKIFNKPNYDAVKRITDPDNIFRDLWAKTCRTMQGARS